MNTKWTLILVFTVVISLVGFTIWLARKLIEKDRKDVKEEAIKTSEVLTLETIKDAKKYLEEDSEFNGGMMMTATATTIINNHTLGELLALEPEDKDYAEFIKLTGERVRDLYDRYQFMLYEPEKSDLVSGFLVQFQILGHEDIYDKLFTLAMDRGLDMDEVDDHFYEELMKGEIIPIGEGIVIEREGTGISPIKTGDDVRVIISFLTDEYKALQEEAEAAKNDNAETK